MSEWKKVKLGDVCQIIDGDRGKNYPKNHEFFGSGYCLFLNTGNVTKEGFSFANNQFITKEKDELLRKGKIQRGDLILTTRGTVGNIAYYTNHIKYENVRINSGMVILRVNKENVDASFLYQLVRSKESRTYINSFCTGSAQPQLPIKNLSQICFEIPSLSTQHRIATILSRYDSLIENYQKQIKLLEEAAQRLYKEWFVDFHFPGYENTMIVDGVPEGWEKKKVKEVCDTTSGGTPSRSKTEFYTGDILWVKTKELNDDFIFDTEEKITEDAIRNSSAKMVPSGSILMAMYGATIGKLGIATKELSCNQACCVFLLPEDSTLRLYLYNWLLNSRTLLISMGKGAAQPNLSQDMIKNLEVVVPSSCLLAKFDSKVKPLYRIMSYHSSQIRILTEARDRLLPKLMSGEITV